MWAATSSAYLAPHPARLVQSLAAPLAAQAQHRVAAPAAVPARREARCRPLRWLE